MYNFKRTKGQSTVEYAIVTAAVAGALLTPVPRSELIENTWLKDYQGKNVMTILNDRLKRAYNAYSYAKSLPPLPKTSR
ncbi:hypothetical protein [Pseudoalteromonas sp. T1lg10]|uniref:hypothetical protein n=1 Tax=Pseudoalteromonas sp. T1lg10 TaxID=2077093 RepID=UPI000CF73CF5|nr:hypothetical protein [Pseudoalteromonas sp. T1lg10]